MKRLEGKYRGKRIAPQEKKGSRAALPEAGTAGAAGETGGKGRKKTFWSEYGYLIITALVVLLVFRVLLQLAYVPSASMESTIPEPSLLIAWQLPYLAGDPQPERGDIVTFWNEELHKLLVKRVIGLPGEEISFSEGYVYVNGVRLDEPYLDQQGITVSGKHESFQVPEGCLLMMGDNRTGSNDSRSWTMPYMTLSTVRSRVLVCVPVRYVALGEKIRIPLPQLDDIRLLG